MKLLNVELVTIRQLPWINRGHVYQITDLLTGLKYNIWAIIGDWPREIVEALSRPFAMVLSIGIGGCYYKEKKGVTSCK